MNKRINYKRLRTIEDVRAERIRLTVAINNTERDLEDDYRRLRDYFTLDYWVGAVTGQLSGIGSSSQWIATGYNIISALIQRYRDNRPQREARKAVKRKKKKEKLAASCE